MEFSSSIEECSVLAVLVENSYILLTGSVVDNIVFTLKVRYDLNCVKSAAKPQPTNQPTTDRN